MNNGADQEIERLQSWTRASLVQTLAQVPEIDQEMIENAVQAESRFDLPATDLKLNQPATETLLHKLVGEEHTTTKQICGKLLRSLRMACFTHRHGEAPAYQDEPFEIDGERPPEGAGQRARK